MRITMVMYGAVFAALGLLGCAGDVAERETSLMRRVDEVAMTSQVLYAIPGVATPLTLADLEAQEIDRTVATPVRVEMYDTVAVAWFAPEGVALLGRDNIIRIWSVVERQPISDEIAPDEIIVTPSEEPFLFEGPAVSTDTDLATQVTEQTIDTDLVDPIGQTIIDFVDQIGGSEELELLREVAERHPGCI